jgi:hypothetical protein
MAQGSGRVAQGKIHKISVKCLKQFILEQNTNIYSSH